MSSEQKGASFSRYEYVLNIFSKDRKLTEEMGTDTVAVCRPNRTKKDFPIGVIFVTDRIHAKGLDAQKLGKYGVLNWGARLLVDKEEGPVKVVEQPLVEETPAPPRRRNGGPDRKKAKAKTPKEKKVFKPSTRNWMFKPGKKANRSADRPKDAAIANPQAIETENAGAATKELPAPEASVTVSPPAESELVVQPAAELESKPPVEESTPAEAVPEIAEAVAKTTESTANPVKRTVGLFAPLTAYDPKFSDKPSLDFVRKGIPWVPGVVILSNLSSVAQLLQPFIDNGDVDAKEVARIVNNLIDDIHRRTVLNAEEDTANAG